MHQNKTASSNKKTILILLSVILCVTRISAQLQEININTGACTYGDITESGSNPNNFAELNGDLVFTTNYIVSSNPSPMESKGIYRSDGTSSGTIQISSIVPFSNEIEDEEMFVNSGSFLFFKSIDYSSGWQNPQHQLWRTDGNASGTLLVKDFLEKEFCSNLCEMNGNLYLITKNFDPVWGNITHELWKSDGTLNGTSVIQTWQNSTILNSNIYLRAFNNKIYFVGFESNGTTAGTLQSGVALPFESNSCLHNGLIYYQGSNGKLWRTDGTLNGTFMAVDYPVANWSGGIISYNGWIYFSGGYNGVGQPGTELCKTDGTQVNTLMVKDIYLGFNSSNPSDYIAVNGNLFFLANDGVNERQLWKTDGTTSGTQLVKIFSSGYFYEPKAPHDNLLYFARKSYANSTIVQELWKTDGTEINTVLVHQFDSIGVMKDINCNLFITADDNLSWYIRNVELWSDTSSCASANVYDMRNSSSISIFPNPTSDVLNILLPNSQNVGNFKLTDQYGKIVKKEAIESNEMVLNLSDLSQGIYFLSVEGINEVKRIIKH
jgi:ELWxxDGT repeat protein